MLFSLSYFGVLFDTIIFYSMDLCEYVRMIFESEYGYNVPADVVSFVAMLLSGLSIAFISYIILYLFIKFVSFVLRMLGGLI